MHTTTRNACLLILCIGLFSCEKKRCWSCKETKQYTPNNAATVNDTSFYEVCDITNSEMTDYEREHNGLRTDTDGIQKQYVTDCSWGSGF